MAKPKPRKWQPGITVITPALPDRAHLLAEAIASVNAQTLQPAAHLISVDMHHHGPGPTLNQLVKASRTEWLSILADDDLYDPDHLETLMAHADEADMVLSWSRIEGRDVEQYRGEFHPYDLLQKQDTGMRGTFMFRRSLWEKVGGWPTGLCDDWQFMVNAINAKARLVPVYRETWTYRFHGGNLSEVIGQLGRGETPAQLYHLSRYQ